LGIGNLTQLAPYFIAATTTCLDGGYWLCYRRGIATGTSSIIAGVTAVFGQKIYSQCPVGRGKGARHPQLCG